MATVDVWQEWSSQHPDDASDDDETCPPHFNDDTHVELEDEDAE